MHPDVAIYSLGSVALTDSVFVVGNCPDSLPMGEGCKTTPQQFVVGTNEVDAVVNTTTVAGTSEFSHIGLRYERSTGQSDLGDTRFEGGDSGGPTFIVSGGALQLVGIHSGIIAADEISVDVAVQAYNVLDVIAVPEPNGFLLVGLIAVLGGFWHRRKIHSFTF